MENIIVFGMGKYFEWKRETLEQKYKIIKFLDNRVEKNKTELYQNTGIEIINPDDLNGDDDTVIFLMSVHFVSMWRQLCRAGISPARIRFPYTEKPFFENDGALCHDLSGITFSQDFFTCTRKNGEVIKVRSEEEWRNLLRKAYRSRYPLIRAMAEMETEPISRQFGTERGTPVDRYYIERFLEEHRQMVRGDVLEIEDSAYSLRYGEERIQKTIVMDVGREGGDITFRGNLETGEGIKDGIADCFILTQTLMYIFDLKSAAHHIARLLKRGGCALITCSGISQNSKRCMDDYGCCFNFNQDALRRLFEQEPDMEVTEIGSYGNVKTVSAHLNGLCFEDLTADDFVPNDKYYPLIVYAVVRKIEK